MARWIASRLQSEIGVPYSEALRAVKTNKPKDRKPADGNHEGAKQRFGQLWYMRAKESLLLQVLEREEA